MIRSEIARTDWKRPAVVKESKRRQRKCALKSCRAVFEPRSITHKTCSPECALLHVQVEKARQCRKKRQEGLKALRTRSDWMKDAQATFNAFIRARDQLAGYPCISSGLPLDWSGNNVDAGHYRSRGTAPHLRFDERNCHAQSKKENRYNSGNAVDYRVGLIARIGLAAVEQLESDQTPRKWSIDELKAIKNHYKAALRALKEPA